MWIVLCGLRPANPACVGTVRSDDTRLPKRRRHRQTGPHRGASVETLVRGFGMRSNRQGWSGKVWKGRRALPCRCGTQRRGWPSAGGFPQEIARKSRNRRCRVCISAPLSFTGLRVGSTLWGRKSNFSTRNPQKWKHAIWQRQNSNGPRRRYAQAKAPLQGSASNREATRQRKLDTRRKVILGWRAARSGGTGFRCCRHARPARAQPRP